RFAGPVSSSGSSSATRSSCSAPSPCRSGPVRGERGRVAPARTRAAADSVPRSSRSLRLPRVRALRPWLPSARSLAAALGVLALAAGAYGVARETSAFAVVHIEVVGGSPQVRAQVRRAVAELRGRSLLGLDGAALIGTVDAVPTIVAAGYDR